jgi:hypothetical protein
MNSTDNRGQLYSTTSILDVELTTRQGLVYETTGE